MPDHHRGRSRRDYYDDVYDDDDDPYYYTYKEEQRPIPRRHRSLGRQALDKLEDAMGGLGIDRAISRTRTRSPSSHRRHDDSGALVLPHHHHHHDDYYDDGYSRSDGRTRRGYHSASPTRRSHSHSHSHHSTHRSRSRSKSRRWERGLIAAADAAAIEAYRLRKEPGKWKGPKGERIATAAISAAVIGAATSDRHHHGGVMKDDDGGNKKGALGSALGGLVVNRLVNGPRREVRR